MERHVRRVEVSVPSEDKKTLYIPKSDRKLWQAAERVADAKEISLYKVLREALDKQLPLIAAAPAPSERWDEIAAGVQSAA